MLRVPSTVKPSPVAGLGCFTNVPIEKGQVVWVEDVGLDTYVDVRTLVSKVGEKVARDLLSYCFRVPFPEHICILPCDNARFVNHSENPNIGTNPDGPVHVEYALRDISAGEELLDDYRSYNLEFEPDGKAKAIDWSRDLIKEAHFDLIDKFNQEEKTNVQF